MSEYAYEHREIGLGFTVTNTGGRGSAFDVLTAKTVEPVRRNKDGWRFVGHRFPIKGGISRLEAMRMEMVQALFSEPPLCGNE